MSFRGALANHCSVGASEQCQRSPAARGVRRTAPSLGKQNRTGVRPVGDSVRGGAVGIFRWESAGAAEDIFTTIEAAVAAAISLESPDQ